MPHCSGGYQYRMMYIRREKIRDILTCHGEFKDPPRYFTRPAIRDDRAAGLLHNAFAGMDGDAPDSLESHSRLVRAVTLLFHCHAGRNPYLARGGKDHRVVGRALEYIREKAPDNITLEELASAVGLSPYHFLRIFRDTTGLPPHAYLIQMRVALAKAAIEKGRPLVDAALAAGFSDQSHMTRCFKAVHGLPPGRYKKILFS